MSLETDFSDWIEQINSSENPNSDIIAFYFGLFEKPNGFGMYLVGSKKYHAEDDDWACNTDFEPENKYLEFPEAYSKEKNWEDILNIAKSLVTKYSESNDFKNSIFKNAKAIATGFDDGDLILIEGQSN